MELESKILSMENEIEKSTGTSSHKIKQKKDLYFSVLESLAQKDKVGLGPLLMKLRNGFD